MIYCLIGSHSSVAAIDRLVNRRPEYVGHRKVIGGPDVYSCLASTYLLAALTDLVDARTRVARTYSHQLVYYSGSWLATGY